MEDKHLYKFEEFALHADEHVLRREGEAVPLTPKMLDILLVLVQNHGRIVDKETLLKEVWPDSFVEEGNITFNIRQLRKLLGDDAQSPTYIETIPRRGYRFIADVEKVSPQSSRAEAGHNDVEPADSTLRGNIASFYSYPAAATLAILVCVASIAAWYLFKSGAPSYQLLSEPFASDKLSTTGMVASAAISPDGKTVVYTSRNGTKQSVWLRQLDSANNVSLIPPSDDYYYLLTFSPDGNTIYFSRAEPGLETRIDIFRISIFGGIPEKIVSGSEGWLSLSPDGGKISFVRCPRGDEVYCSLWVADSKDGKNERMLTSRSRPIRIADNKFSPDGTRIAFAVGQSRNQANDFRLMEVNTETGAEREVTAEKFFNIKSLAWLPDSSSLLMTASRIQNKYFRIWHVSASTGAVEPLTNDSEAYGVLSLDKEARRLVSTQIKQDFHLYVFNIDDPSKRMLLADASRSVFAPDGKIYFASAMSGNDEVWSINPDGTGQRQLTNDLAADGAPIPSSDGRSVFFTSNRSGDAQIWRMNPDGSDQRQITRSIGGYPVFASPDSKALYYRHAINGNLCSVSLENGEEKLVFDQPKRWFTISPDGSTIAVEERKASGLFVSLLSLSDGNLKRSFELSKNQSRLLDLSWLPDGRSILYLMSDVDYANNVLYQQSIEGGPPREVGSLGDEEVSEVSGLSISPDGARFTVAQGGWKHDAVLIKGLR